MKLSCASQKYAEQAVKMMKKYDISATPEVYEIVYDHLSGEKHNLSLKVNNHLEKKLPFNMSFIDKLRQEHYRKDAGISTITSGLTDEINQISSSIDDSLSSFASYDSNITQSNEAIKKAKTSGDIIAVIKQLAESNRKMLDKNSAMQKNLKSSKEKVASLDRKLDDTKKLAYTDALTGIANRLQFSQKLQEELDIINTSKPTPLSLIIGDIDYFKKFNDTFGHLVGDQVLRYVGFTLKNIMQEREFCARYGGEEFVVILPENDLNKAYSRAEVICQTIRRKELKRKSTKETLGCITISLGVALYRKGESADELIARADQCLYAAKEAGRNQAKTEKQLGK